MNPDQNPYPVDYLNQIAPEAPKKGMSNKLFLGVIGGGLLVAIIVGLLLLSGGSSNGSTEKMQRLAARLTTLETIADEADRTIKSGQLRSTNSNLKIFLTNTNRDITDPLLKNGVDTKKIDKKIETAENGEKLKKSLEDARLNAVFDRIYAREMSYQLDTVSALMVELYNSSASKSLKDFLVTTNKNLEPLKTQFADFNAANG